MRCVPTVIVVDAGVLVCALLDDTEDGRIARARLRDDALSAPDLITLEVVSVARRLSRAGAVSEERAQAAIRALATLPLTAVPHRRLLPRVWEFRGNLTAYDAAYVAVAEYLGATLLTGDARLHGAPGPTCHIEFLRVGP